MYIKTTGYYIHAKNYNSKINNVTCFNFKVFPNYPQIIEENILNEFNN